MKPEYHEGPEALKRFGRTMTALFKAKRPPTLREALTIKPISRENILIDYRNQRQLKRLLTSRRPNVRKASKG